VLSQVVPVIPGEAEIDADHFLIHVRDPDHAPLNCSICAFERCRASFGPRGNQATKLPTIHKKAIAQLQRTPFYYATSTSAHYPSILLILTSKPPAERVGIAQNSAKRKNKQVIAEKQCAK
jgi:hypothetical protein